MKGIVLRKSRQSDLPGLLELLLHLHADERLPKRPGPIWRTLLKQAGISCLVAVAGAKIIASCILVIVPNLTRGGRPFAMVENVVTHSGHRRQGVGTRMLKFALRLARAKGCYKVMLMTGSKRKSVHRFYQNAGFKKGVKTAFVVRLGRA